jgi:putative salt-induced outer membrane protein YdiY
MSQMLRNPILGVLFTLQLACAVSAQEPQPDQPDQIVLANGDRITGTLKGFADGKIAFKSATLGDLEIKIADVQTLTTAHPVVIRTTTDEIMERRITGIADGRLQFEPTPTGAAANDLAIANLGAINPELGPRWSGAINVGAGLTTGNTNNRSVNATGEAVRRTEDDRFTAKASWIYGDQKIAPGQHSLTDRRVSGFLEYDYFFTKKLYALATTEALADTPADLDLRFAAGAGLGYQWVEREDLSFSTEAGLSYLAEHYRSGAPSTETVAARLASHFKAELTKGVDFLHDLTAFPGLERADDIFLTQDTRLRVSLTESMFTQLQWILDYDNTPSPGRERLDNRYLLSIGWSF